MSRPFPTDSPFLLGNYAPWPLEGEIHDLPIAGELPRELEGTLWRNGPNPQFAPRGRYHWFDGDGMVHAFRFRDGRASYRNRWVRTARFARERAAGESLFGGLANMAGGDPRLLQTLVAPQGYLRVRSSVPHSRHVHRHLLVPQTYRATVRAPRPTLLASRVELSDQTLRFPPHLFAYGRNPQRDQRLDYRHALLKALLLHCQFLDSHQSVDPLPFFRHSLHYRGSLSFGFSTETSNNL